MRLIPPMKIIVFSNALMKEEYLRLPSMQRHWDSIEFQWFSLRLHCCQLIIDEFYKASSIFDVRSSACNENIAGILFPGFFPSLVLQGASLCCRVLVCISEYYIVLWRTSLYNRVSACTMEYEFANSEKRCWRWTEISQYFGACFCSVHMHACVKIIETRKPGTHAWPCRAAAGPWFRWTPSPAKCMHACQYMWMHAGHARFNIVSVDAPKVQDRFEDSLGAAFHALS